VLVCPILNVWANEFEEKSKKNIKTKLILKGLKIFILYSSLKKVVFSKKLQIKQAEFL
tara:strand:- start:6056 stop:6229 length:174 start_codon:yes stop_codon:yes gene_type:complete